MSRVPALREVARRLTAQELGSKQTSDELASATVNLFTTLLTNLSTLLGEAGSVALFRRSIRLAETIVPLYGQVRGADAGSVLDAVGACLREQPPPVASQATEALLTIYIELLATFIGEELIRQLLQEAWPHLRASPSQESEE